MKEKLTMSNELTNLTDGNLGPDVIVTYRTESNGYKVGLFKTTEEAERQAIQWVTEDYPQHSVEALSEVRELEQDEMFAVDLFALRPGETWEND